MPQALSQVLLLNCHKTIGGAVVISIWQMRELRLVHSYKLVRGGQKEAQATGLGCPSVGPLNTRPSSQLCHVAHTIKGGGVYKDRMTFSLHMNFMTQ